MIGQLRGNLLEKKPPMLMLDVQGVGYCVQAPLSTFFVLPAVGCEITLRIHMVVREDAQLLYGFLCEQECRLFQEIIKVNGVGPKVALAILSGLSFQEFIEVIQSQEVNRLQKLPGIGAKTAQRILVEMQDRVAKLDCGSSNAVFSTQPHFMRQNSPVDEAILALISLGYKQQEANKAVAKVKNTNQSCEWIIKEALQGLARV